MGAMASRSTTVTADGLVLWLIARAPCPGDETPGLSARTVGAQARSTSSRRTPHCSLLVASRSSLQRPFAVFDDEFAGVLDLERGVEAIAVEVEDTDVL